MLHLHETICLLAACCALFAIAEQQQQQKQSARQDITEEMRLINKSLEGLLSELAVIKREASGRLVNVKNRASNTIDQSERIRQTKVSRFVLKRVAELESESLGMRDEMNKLFELQQSQEKQTPQASPAEARQEDHDFDELPQQQMTTGNPTNEPQSSAATTTVKPEEEAAAIGFDLEALKKLGDELENEIEARQAQRPESLRGVHEQVIKLVDNMVQTYLGNTRRAVQRLTNFIDGSRGTKPREQVQPRQSTSPESKKSIITLGGAIVDDLQTLNGRFHDFTIQWAGLVGRQQSPLIDRLPARGVEIWRDFWETVRKQVRRINQEVSRLTRDVTRTITGRLPSPAGGEGGRNAEEPIIKKNLFYSANSAEQKINEQFQEFYSKLGATLREEQQKLDKAITGMNNVEISTVPHKSSNNGGAPAVSTPVAQNLIDESDDEATRQELSQNVALRQQIQQEINVFGSIFDIMRAFIQRLRESATVFRDVLNPGAMNSNDAVTPGPSIKPTVDQLLDETVNSQRNINGQSKPVLLPNDRPRSRAN